MSKVRSLRSGVRVSWLVELANHNGQARKMGHIINCLFISAAVAFIVGLLMWVFGHPDIVIAYSMTALGVGMMVGSVLGLGRSRY